MSITLGKSKNWGSRSGKMRKVAKGESSILQQLEKLGCSDDLLNAVIATPDAVKSAATELITKRNREKD